MRPYEVYCILYTVYCLQNVCVYAAMQCVHVLYAAMSYFYTICMDCLGGNEKYLPTNAVKGSECDMCDIAGREKDDVAMKV